MKENIVKDNRGRAYELGTILGEGGQGTVWRVNGDSRYVIKTQKCNGVANADNQANIILRDDGEYKKYLQSIRRLMALSQLADLKNIAIPYSVLQEPTCGYVMRFMDGMEPLKEQMKPNDDCMLSIYNKNSSLAKKLGVLKKIAEILLRIHSQGLVYCDLSPQNVFVSKSYKYQEVWLIDADNIVYANKSKQAIGTPFYRAPEICLGQSINTFKSDLYSFALIAFEYLTGSKPFDDIEDDEEEDDWGDGDCTSVEKGEVAYVYEVSQDSNERLPLEFVCTDSMRNLFWRTFNQEGRKNPASRPSAGEWVEALEEACNSVCCCFYGENPHDFLAPNCHWCKYKNVDNNEYKVYRLTLSYAPQMSVDEDWTQTEPFIERQYFCNNCYYSVKATDKKTSKIIMTDSILPQRISTDTNRIKISVSKDGVVDFEDCYIKTSYDRKPNGVGKSAQGKLKCKDMRGDFFANLILERIR